MDQNLSVIVAPNPGPRELTERVSTNIKETPEGVHVANDTKMADAFSLAILPFSLRAFIEDGIRMWLAELSSRFVLWMP